MILGLSSADKLDCEDCRHLTVVDRHDTGPRSPVLKTDTLSLGLEAVCVCGGRGGWVGGWGMGVGGGGGGLVSCQETEPKQKDLRQVIVSKPLLLPVKLYVLPLIQRQAIADLVIQQTASSLAVRDVLYLFDTHVCSRFRFSERSGFGLSQPQNCDARASSRERKCSFVCLFVLFLCFGAVFSFLGSRWVVIPCSRVSPLHYDNADHASVQRWCSGSFHTLESRPSALKRQIPVRYWAYSPDYWTPPFQHSTHYTPALYSFHSSFGFIPPQNLTSSIPVSYLFTPELDPLYSRIGSFHHSIGLILFQNWIHSPQYWTHSIRELDPFHPSIGPFQLQYWTHFIPVLDPFYWRINSIQLQSWIRSTSIIVPTALHSRIEPVSPQDCNNSIQYCTHFIPVVDKFTPVLDPSHPICVLNAHQFGLIQAKYWTHFTPVLDPSHPICVLNPHQFWDHSRQVLNSFHPCLGPISYHLCI